MLRRISILVALFLISLPASAGDRKEAKRTSWTGYLIDVACAIERKDAESDLGEKHTKKCMEMPPCDHSGFGLLTDGNEFLPFDENGNRKVRALLQQTKQSDRLRVVVRGTRAKDVLQARKIELK